MVLEKLRQIEISLLFRRRTLAILDLPYPDRFCQTCLGAVIGLLFLLLPDLAKANKPDVTGVWDWHNRLTTKSGDIRDEQEAWLLLQEGNKIHGRYQRTVTFLSTKGKPYACNGLVRYQRIALYRIEGTVEGSRITLKEVSVQVQPGPCDDGQRRLDSYQGSLVSNRLHIRWSGGEEVLQRRNLTGLWKGRTVKTVQGGDQATWTEVWRLRQTGSRIVGLRDRVDIRHSGDGQSYRCSHTLKIVRFLRWQLHGRLLGPRLTISLETPIKRSSPCERRRLSPTRLILQMDYDPNKLKLSSTDASLVLVRQDKIDPGVPAPKPAKKSARQGEMATRRKQ